VIAKQLELSSAVPSVSRVAALFNPNNPFYPPMVKSLQSAAQKAGITVLPVSAGNLEDLEPAFTTMKRQHADIVIVLDDSFFITRRREIASLTGHYQLPSIAGSSDYAGAGVLMSYGGLIGEQFRRGANYVDKIFKGAKPANLPVEQPTRFYLTVNQRTAKILGLTLSPALLLRADEVIQ
jgi:ABC-type uncharacterized transport system substrate-binding protein